MELKKREIAKKTWVCNLINGIYTKSSGWTPGYVESGGEKYSRVSLVATVVARFLSEDGNYASATLDDGTETIRLKAFGPDVMKIRDVAVGSIVRCIGKVRMYNDEIYLTPEILLPLNDPNWLLMHRLQAGSPNGAPNPEDTKPKMPEQAAVDKLQQESDATQKKILDMIRNLDSGSGSDINEVVQGSGMDEEEAKKILFSLLKSGDIYEPKKGRLKVLD